MILWLKAISAEGSIGTVRNDNRTRAMAASEKAQVETPGSPFQTLTLPNPPSISRTINVDSVYFGSMLVPGGGMAFVDGPFAGLLATPAHVLIFVRIVKMFLCLAPDPVSYPEPLPELPLQQTASVVNPKQFRQSTREIR